MLFLWYCLSAQTKQTRKDSYFFVYDYSIIQGLRTQVYAKGQTPTYLLI